MSSVTHYQGYSAVRLEVDTDPLNGESSPSVRIVAIVLSSEPFDRLFHGSVGDDQFTVLDTLRFILTTEAEEICRGIHLDIAATDDGVFYTSVSTGQYLGNFFVWKFWNIKHIKKPN